MAGAIEKWFESKPINELTEIEGAVDRIFNNMLNLKRKNGRGLNFSPSCDVSEEKDSLVFRFDLPGVAKENVKVETNKDQLTIHAERREEKKQEDKKKYLSEICYGSYMRSFTLPSAVDAKMVNAKFENGVLTVSVPKTPSEAPKSQQIPVQ